MLREAGPLSCIHILQCVLFIFQVRWFPSLKCLLYFNPSIELTPFLKSFISHLLSKFLTSSVKCPWARSLDSLFEVSLVFEILSLSSKYCYRGVLFLIDDHFRLRYWFLHRVYILDVLIFFKVPIDFNVFHFLRSWSLIEPLAPKNCSTLWGTLSSRSWFYRQGILRLKRSQFSPWGGLWPYSPSFFLLGVSRR